MMTQFIQNLCFLRRQIHIQLPIEYAQASHNLNTALSQEIVLRGGVFQIPRRYWGTMNQEQLKFHGPSANRQFCFQLDAILEETGASTSLKGTLYLRDLDVYQLLLTLMVISGLLGAMFRWSAIAIAPLFYGFLYVMVQWHFQFYAKEIHTILTNLMEGKVPQTR